MCWVGPDAEPPLHSCRHFCATFVQYVRAQDSYSPVSDTILRTPVDMALRDAKVYSRWSWHYANNLAAFTNDMQRTYQRAMQVSQEGNSLHAVPPELQWDWDQATPALSHTCPSTYQLRAPHPWHNYSLARSWALVLRSPSGRKCFTGRASVAPLQALALT